MLYLLYEVKRKEEKREILKNLCSQLQLIDYEPAEDIKEIAEKLISAKPELNFIADFGIQIGYVRAFENKKASRRLVFADCRKINGAYLAYLPFDFIITVYEPNIMHLTDNQRKLVIYHELMHIGVTERGLAVKPHDIEDFESILKEYGLDWNQLGNDVPDILAGGGSGEKDKKNNKKVKGAQGRNGQ